MVRNKRDSGKYKELLRQVHRFGKLVAEEDGDLSKYYVGKEQYLSRALDLSDTVSFFIGPKGVGKSAILQMVRLERATDDKRIINITPDDLAFSAIANIRSPDYVFANANIDNQQWLFKSLWNYVLLLELWTRETSSNQRPALFKKIFSDHKQQKITKLFDMSFNTVGEPINMSFTHKILRLIEGLEVETPMVKAKVTLNEGKTSYNLLNEINDAVKTMPTLLKHEYYILVDDLDLHWRNEPSQNVLIAALFQTIKKLSRDKIKILVSIREDIFSKLPLQDKDKMRDKICRISWSIDSLKKMVEKRIVSIVGYCKEEEIWGDIFPSNSFEQMARHSSFKPREIIRLASLCIETSSTKGHKRILESDFSEALIRYSQERIEDLDSDYNYVYTGLAYVINKFYGKSKEFAFESIRAIATELELERMCKEGKSPIPWRWAGCLDSNPNQLAKILMDIGFLQFKTNRTARPENYEPSKHGELGENTWFAIHPMYGSGLSLLGN
jgi:hypothetical protein